MKASLIDAPFRSIVKYLARLAFLIAVIVIGSGTVHAATFSIGAPEIIYTKSQRSSGGGSAWPDGNLGVISNGDGTYDFYGANGSKPVLTTGTLTKPGGSKKSVSITNVPKKTYNYLAGGPVYEDPYSGARLMVYHAEVHQGSIKKFYSVLGLAISTDPEGRTFRDLGAIIRPNIPSGLAEVGGGSFAIIDGHLNVYYKDWLSNGLTSEVAVARAPMAELMTNSLLGQPTSFTKYYNGGWSEPGLGGNSSHLETVNSPNSWLSVSYNDYLGQLMMVTSQWSDDKGDLYYALSDDGINWGARQPLAIDPGEQFYPTIIGKGSDPTRSGKSFYVYYTDSKKGVWSRWNDAQLRRREIIIDPQNPDSFDPPPSSLGYSAEWVSISGYQADFQEGSPSDGWKYGWNPKGKLGKSSDYIPLLWSDSAQAYNTTGATTMIPDPKTHHDDHLSLTFDGGHPGLPKYMPMAGYTIQEDDGAGLYRLFDTSIQKNNNTLFNKEDGLQVLVYVNDTLIESEQNVLTDGLITSFDQTLGTLNVGDTIWVMVNPLKNQIDDSFVNFDFSIQKLVFAAEQFPLAAQQRLSSAAIPEPSTITLLLLAFGFLRLRNKRIEASYR